MNTLAGENMKQSERRIYLIKFLLSEHKEYQNIIIPKNTEEQKILLRSLMNIREAKPICDEFLAIQDASLKSEIPAKGIIDYKDTEYIGDGIYLWKGDITTLKCDAIVNAANSGMLGCFYPNHHCIDNAIHTYAGVQLRQECNRLMTAQGHSEKTGTAKITKAYNLPCKYVIHTVGPITSGTATKRNTELLQSSYLSCLRLAEEHKLESIAFCCISTGEFLFPNKKAADTAISTVLEYKKYNKHIEVIFNVFKEEDYKIYRELLTKHKPT